jgi:beta-mannosidase
MGPAAAGAGPHDVLNGSVWECRWNQPQDEVDTTDASRDDWSWMPAPVPGTAASALRDLGHWTWGDDDQSLLDGSDWWYRCRFDAPEGALEGPWQFDLDGLATVADVWLNDEHLLHSENMWVAHQLDVDRLEARNTLLLRFAALAPRPGVGSEWGASGTLAPSSPPSCRDRAVGGRAQRACQLRRG